MWSAIPLFFSILKARVIQYHARKATEECIEWKRTIRKFYSRSEFITAWTLPNDTILWIADFTLQASSAHEFCVPS